MDTARKTPTQFFVIFLFLSGMVLYAGCNDVSDRIGEDNAALLEENVEDEGEPVYFETVGFGQSTAVPDTIETVIRDQESLDDFEQLLNVSHPFRDVDFSQAVVLLVAVPVPTGGYSIGFDSIDRFEGSLVAQYVITIPGDDCITPMGRSVPYIAVLIPRTEQEVRFEHKFEEMPCGFKNS